MCVHSRIILTPLNKVTILVLQTQAYAVTWRNLHVLQQMDTSFYEKPKINTLISH